MRFSNELAIAEQTLVLTKEILISEWTLPASEASETDFCNGKPFLEQHQQVAAGLTLCSTVLERNANVAHSIEATLQPKCHLIVTQTRDLGLSVDGFGERLNAEDDNENEDRAISHRGADARGRGSAWVSR